MIRKAASSGCPEFVRDASSTVKAASSLRLKRLDSKTSCFQNGTSALSAACGGEPDVLGQVVRPHVSHTDKSFELLGFDLVGGYALQPRWADGHSTGIYSFTYLRRLAQHSD